MNVATPIVTSDERVSISQMIAGEYLYKSGWMYNFMSTVHRDKKELVFNDYKFFWKYGIFLKRYFELPVNDLCNDMEDFFDKYLNKNYYIICYLDIREGRCNKEKCILFYKTEVIGRGKVYSCCEWRENKVYNLRGTISELNKTFQMKNLSLLRCDLLRKVNQESYKFDLEMIKDELYKGKSLSFYDKMAVFISSKKDAEKNLVVLQEWMTMHKARKKYVNSNYEEIEIYMKLFDRIMKTHISARIKVIRLVTLYNKITKYLKGVIEDQ